MHALDEHCFQLYLCSSKLFQNSKISFQIASECTIWPSMFSKLSDGLVHYLTYLIILFKKMIIIITSKQPRTKEINMFWAFYNHSARQTRTLNIHILAVLTSVSLMRKWLKPGRLFCPYFRSDPWLTESLNRNGATWCDGTVSRRARIHHRAHWRAYCTSRIRYDCLNIAEHELTRCHDGLTKDYHGVSRWYYSCIMTFQFWVFGEAVTWLSCGLHSGLFVFHLKAQGTGGHFAGLITVYQ